MLPPGKSRTFRVALDYPFDGAILAPGTYEAQAVYYAKSRALVPGAAADLVSNTVTFTVSAP